MKRQFIILFTEFIFISNFALSQGPWTIKGLVTDSKTNSPVCYAQISCSDRTNYTMSNDEGEFQLSALIFPATLNIHKFGYEQKTILLNSAEDIIRVSLVPLEFHRRFESDKIRLQYHDLLRKAIDKLKKNSIASAPDPFNKNLVYCRITTSVDSVTNSLFESYTYMNIPRYSLQGYKSDVARYVAANKMVPGISSNRLEYTIDPLVSYSLLMDLGNYVNRMGYFEQDGNRIVMIGLFMGGTERIYYLNANDTSVIYIKSISEQPKKSKLPGPVKTWQKDLIVSTEISLSPFNEKTKNYQTDYVISNESFRLIHKKQPGQAISKSTLFASVPDSSLIPAAVKEYVFNESLEGPGQQISSGVTYTRSGNIPLFESETQKLLSGSYNPAFWQQNSLIRPDSREEKQIQTWENDNRFYSVDRLQSGNQIAFDTLIRKLNRNIVAVENVYLETDRSDYLAGDTIWFSAFVTGNRNMDSTSMSRILYVDLINAGNKVEKHLKLLIRNGRAKGDFELGNELKNGIFRIRAYTQWMRNFQSDYLFQKDIPVYQSDFKNLITVDPLINKSNIGDSVNLYFHVLLPSRYKTLEKSLDVHVRLNDTISVSRSFRFTDDFRGSMGFFVPDSIASSFADLKMTLSDTSFISEQRVSLPLNAGIKIQFFPESGKMVAGINTVIAYKAADNKGDPAEFNADLVDASQNIITHITGNKSGVGKFSFTPQLNQSYKAVVTLSGNKYSFNLPSTEPKGFVMNYNSDSSVIYLKNNEDIKEINHYIMASVRGTVCSAIELKLDTETVIIRLPFNRYPKGIVQITLSDSLYRPLAERLVFNNRPDKKMLIHIETDKKKYSQKEKVNLTISVTDYAGNPVESSLSMSVADGSKTDTLTSSPDIESFLYLTSELKGNIDYSLLNLSDTTPAGNRNIDLVMMTQGWRNYLWNSIRYSNTLNELYPLEKGFYIDGRISGSYSQITGSDYRLNVFDPGTGFNEVVNVDKKNSFKIDLPLFYDTHLLVIQNRINKNRIDEMRFTLDTFPVPEIVFRNNELPYFSYKPGYLSTINKKIAENDSVFEPDKKYIMIPEVVVRARSRPWYSKPDITINMDKVDPTGKKYGSVMQMIQGEFGEKAFPKDYGGGRLSPILVVDGNILNPIAHASDDVQAVLAAYAWGASRPVNEISDVKFYEAGSEYSKFYSFRVSNVRTSGEMPHKYQSVVSFNTYLANGRNYYRGAPKGAVLIPFQGFYQAKEFYQPDYDHSKSKETDNRTTIYWDPEIKTDFSGKANVSFFNSDLKGNAVIRISGVSFRLRDASSAVSHYESK